MFRARPRRAEPIAVATSQELLRAALQRSARRNARVAGWRLTWRWLVWGAAHLLRLSFIATIAGALMVGAWTLWQRLAQGDAVTATAPASSARLPGPAPASAPPRELPAVTADTPAPGLRLRLDESVTPNEAPPAAQSDTKPNPNRPTTP